ncbi:MAG: hypothetical protein J1F40_01285 [Prevotellaceae bacterium]|nr:hypothetical protein [Prevotellaceae bacterium]
MKQRYFIVVFAMFMAMSLCVLPSARCCAAETAASLPADNFKKSAVVKAFRGYMKDKNYAKAKAEIDNAVAKYEVASKDAELYKYKLAALDGLIGTENNKIYLQSKPDTTSFFNYIYELYLTGLKCDSLEQQYVAERHAEHKKAEPKLRRGVGQTMLPYRRNMLNAGKFYYKKRDYANAFKFLDMYAQTKSADVFVDAKGNSIVDDPDDVVSVSVLAVLSAYGSDNYSGVMSYLLESLKDEELVPQMLEIGSKSCAELGDTTKMVDLLVRGFEEYPETEYFFMTLTKYYNDNAMYDKALGMAVRMCELNPKNRDYWFLSGKEYLLIGNYDKACASFEKCVEIKADDAEAFSAIGNIYLHEAHEAYAKFNVSLSDPSYAKGKASINGYYTKACAAFEQAKTFDEANKDLWLSGLREAYFKLNKGRQLKALEKYK